MKVSQMKAVKYNWCALLPVFQVLYEIKKKFVGFSIPEKRKLLLNFAEPSVQWRREGGKDIVLRSEGRDKQCNYQKKKYILRIIARNYNFCFICSC